ncbi:hypothetical protein [Mycolicibacterium iranicum]|uniref:Uncharacterized protein n=1 Tax=Mycolicibacterium iranicum TaxID=912594 RepID=A0A178LPZ6_MYCIR|nr:hypothetical protein [Mycolicibacterium iranicum]OAN33571.1 hypothetical protein A4X20_27805 [Mycolicibacterium iranicum]
MTPSQRSILLALATGVGGFLVLFAFGVAWLLSAGLGALLAVFALFTLNYLSPTDKQGELDDNVRRLDQFTTRIRALSLRVADDETRASLQAGCDAMPGMIEIIRSRDIRVALPLSQRSLLYVKDVAETLDDYVDIQDQADAKYLALGQQELQKFVSFARQPDRELSEQKMNEYINSLTALNLNQPPELS